VPSLGHVKDNPQEEKRRVIKKMAINKKILASVFIIGLLAFGLGWGTYSYFSDTEKSTGNVFTAGTIDIAVDGQNPWAKTYSAELMDVKPSETRWITFVITNPGGNPVKVWKHITNIVCSGGAHPESEKAEDPSNTRNWLPPYILYDLYTSIRGWIVKPEQQIRVDNINCMWIYLGQIPGGGSMTVQQSYHLASWEDAPVPEVTNWAQGDTMAFDIELYAEQIGGPGPIGATDTLTLVKKDPVTWEVIPGTGTLTFKTAADTFDYTFVASGLLSGTNYDLIYYADPWPGTGGKRIAMFTTDGTGAIASTTGSVDLGVDIPVSTDKNYPVGGKIWLVLSSDYDGTKMTAWNPTNYLFEMHLIKYDDTNVP